MTAENQGIVPEIKRLSEAMRVPVSFAKRRTTSVRLVDDERASVEVSMEILIPGVAESDSVPEQQLVSLGMFDKLDRLPDLRAVKTPGKRIPIMGRQYRAFVLASLLLAKFSSDEPDWQKHSPARPQFFGIDKLRRWELRPIRSLIMKLVVAPPSDADRIAEEVIARVKKPRL